MVVSEDGKQAIVAYYRILAGANPPHRRLRLTGLLPDACYCIDGREYYGSELMQIGIEIAETPEEFWTHPAGDF